jgi:hypothetical protein
LEVYYRNVRRLQAAIFVKFMDYKIELHEEIKVTDNVRLRWYEKSPRKFFTEIIQGWFPNTITKDSEFGVQKLRVVDKVKNEYHEVVTDLKTGEIIHDVHEKLSDHRK